MSLYSIPIGSRVAKTKTAFRRIVDGDVTTSSLVTTPAAATSVTGNVMGCSDFAKARFMFAGAGSDGNTVNYQIILWYPMEVLGKAPQYIPVVTVHGTYTLGTMVLPTTIVAGALIADTVTDDTAFDGLVKHSPADDNVAMVEIDLRGAAYVTVETDLGTGATAAYVFAQFGD
ncbi:MAG: hypothetical protein ABIH03_12325 [Pseudomonadota bacterium]